MVFILGRSVSVEICSFIFCSFLHYRWDSPPIVTGRALLVVHAALGGVLHLGGVGWWWGSLLCSSCLMVCIGWSSWCSWWWWSSSSSSS